MKKKIMVRMADGSGATPTVVASLVTSNPGTANLGSGSTGTGSTSGTSGTSGTSAVVNPTGNTPGSAKSTDSTSAGSSAVSLTAGLGTAKLDTSKSTANSTETATPGQININIGGSNGGSSTSGGSVDGLMFGELGVKIPDTKKLLDGLKKDPADDEPATPDEEPTDTPADNGPTGRRWTVLGIEAHPAVWIGGAAAAVLLTILTIKILTRE